MIQGLHTRSNVGRDPTSRSPTSFGFFAYSIRRQSDLLADFLERQRYSQKLLSFAVHNRLVALNVTVMELSILDAKSCSQDMRSSVEAVGVRCHAPPQSG